MKVISNPPAPGSLEHTRMITASKIPAILGIDPYRSQGDLWLEMSGLAEKEQPDEEMLEAWEWGHAAEESLARWWQAQHEGWTLNPKRGGTTEIAYANEALPFPNLATLDRRARKGNQHHRLEIKTSASRKKWGERGDELPADVIAQTVFQAGVSGIQDGSVIALVSSDMPQRPRLYDAPGNEEVFAGIVDACASFFATLGEAEPPMPDPALIDALKDLHPPIDDADVEAPADLVAEYRHTKLVLDEAADDHEQSKQALLAVLGNAKRLVDVDGNVIVTQMPGRFSQKNVPDEAKHLLNMPEVMTPKFDTKKFKQHYPDLYQAATGPNTTRFN